MATCESKPHGCNLSATKYKITHLVPLTDGGAQELTDEVELGVVEHFPASTNSFFAFYPEHGPAQLYLRAEQVVRIEKID